MNIKKPQYSQTVATNIIALNINGYILQHTLVKCITDFLNEMNVGDFNK
jgi:hypothetical protein